MNNNSYPSFAPVIILAAGFYGLIGMSFLVYVLHLVAM